MTTTNRPNKMTWARDGYTIWIDEDGVHLNIPRARSFEMPEVVQMLDLHAELRAAFSSDSPFGKPVPPTRQELPAYPVGYVVERAKRAAVKAIDADLNPDADNDATPF